MGVRIPIGYAQATMRFSVAGDSEWMACTLGIYDGGAGFDPLAYANGWIDAWDASAFTTATELAAGWSVGSSFVTTMLPSGPVTIETGIPLAGTRVGQSLPNNCAALIRKQTALGGRRNKGRFFLPSGYLLETEVNQVGTIDPARVATLQSASTGLITALGVEGLVPVLFHENGIGTSTITALLVQPKLATQRTRMRR